MNRFYEFFKKYRLGILSGLIVGTSYIPFYPWGLFFSYLPLWYWVFFKARSGREAFIAGWLTQFTLTFIGFHWVAYTAKEFGGFPWPIAILIFLLFCVLAHLYIPISVYFVYQLRSYFNWTFNQTILPLLTLVFLLESLWPGIFPWHLGYTLLWTHLPIFQFADIIGFEGLSFVIYALQAGFFYFLFRNYKIFSWTRALKPLSAIIALFIGLNVIGQIYGQKWQVADSEIKILQVQANIGNLERMFAEKGKGFREEIAKKFIQLTETSLQENSDVDLVIWPEVAIPEFLNSTHSTGKSYRLVKEYLERSQKTLLTGAFSKDKTIEDPERSVFNAMFLLDPLGSELSKPYHKTHLLAFGEYLPFSEQFPILGKILPFVSNFGRGLGPTVLVYPLDQARGNYLFIGGQICYEGLFPEFTVGLVKKGAEVIVNVTNDSWFGIPFEPYQHLFMTLARGIESRRPLIRSTNTGISAYITAYGEISELSPWNKEWAKRQVIPYRNNPEQTLFIRFGHYLWIVILIAFLALLLINIIYDKFRKS